MPYPAEAIGEILADPIISRVVDYFGIERVALLQTLDVGRVPIVAVVCPESVDVIKVYSGKGSYLRQAVLGAVMECVERTAARWRHESVYRASVADLRLGHQPFYSPVEFTERKHVDWDESQAMPWVVARSLRDGIDYFVPADLVFWGTNRPSMAPVFEAVSTNGLAAHFSRDSAIKRGLREIVERHVVSEVELAAGDRDMMALLGMAEAAGVRGTDVINAFGYRTDCAVDCPPRGGTIAARIVADFAAQGITVYTKLLSCFCGLYVVGCASTETGYRGDSIACAGYGAQPDLSSSIDDAALEMCQSRAADLHGAREDCGLDDKRRSALGLPLHWLLRPSSRIITEVPAVNADWFSRCIQSFRDVLVWDFLPDDDISAVRVIAPGSQSWHITAGQSSDFRNF